MKDLSILIPTYNDPCFQLVDDLRQQAERLNISYEIIVADDGSTDTEVVSQNRAINGMTNCRLVERPENMGRAAIRNFLAQEACYEWLLFIDSDMVVCREDYLLRYIETDAPVVDGGIVIRNVQEGNLRALYEQAAAQQHTVEKRRQSPYHDFHTANFLIHRDVMLAHPFDNRFRHYGYEDVLWGKHLQEQHIDLLHIDNPMSFEIFEDNASFVSKTEEGLRTLHTFRDELKGYSRLLDVIDHLPHRVLRLWHHIAGGWERRHLMGNRPSLFIFKLYKIGFYLSL